MDDHRIGLESKLTMLERTVEALSSELVEHARRIEALQQQVEVLAGHLRRQHGGEPIEPHDTRPPHYGG